MSERELKLALPGRFSLPALTLGEEPLGIVLLPDLNLRATYYDTPDLRLARHGVTLRYRTGEDGGPMWTLKLPIRNEGSTTERNEWHLDGPGREPPARARALVTAYARRAPLGAVATLRIRRRRMHLINPQADVPVAEVDVDEVSVVEGRRVVSRFRELEVEDLRGDLDLATLAEQLTEAGATGAEPIPKVVRALGSRATAPPDAHLASIPDHPTMADALRAALADAIERLVKNDPLARMGEAEGIHQVRVAIRRLRSDLRTLADAVDPGWRATVEPQLQAIGHSLAEARDLDVLIDSLRATGDLAVSLRAFFAEMDARRRAAQTRLQGAMEAPEYAALLDVLVAGVSSPPIGPAANESADSVLPELALEAWDRFRKRAKDLAPGQPDDEFHRARIAAKRARYAAELAGRVLPDRRDDAQRFADRLAQAQDQLGLGQDAAFAEVAIRSTMRGRGVAYAFEAGRLVERQRARSAAARAEFLDSWPELKKRRWRKWAS